VQVLVRFQLKLRRVSECSGYNDVAGYSKLLVYLGALSFLTLCLVARLCFGDTGRTAVSEK
jgi:hypothetical protein